ncbi:hypothetical protein GNF82_13580 [Clostridium perfringens]
MDYYRRISNVVNRNRTNLENTFIEVNLLYKIELVSAVVLLAAILMLLELDYLFFVIPAILGTTLLIRTIEMDKD